jgi:hypothetical protein
MALCSIIIPSRNCQYVYETVEDIFEKASGDIEVIVTLDGYRPDRIFRERPNLRVIHLDSPGGMRHGINSMVGMAQGEYILKCDDHVCFGEGFDEILQQDMENNWLVTPTRYRLNPDKWDRHSEAIEYLYLTFPYTHDRLYGSGFHGKKWIGKDGIGKDMGKTQYYWMENARKHIKIDDIQIMQGSGWFTTKKHYESIDGLDEVHCSFFQEANELCFKTWMSGGRCVVNKNTWYAHWHKNESPRFGLSLKAKHEVERFSTWVWMNDKWPKATKTISWFANSKFYPIPGWPATWQQYVKDDGDFRLFDVNGKDGYKLNGPG